MSIPIDFENRMKEMLGDRWELFVDEFQKTPYRALRVNTIKCEVQKFKSIFEFLKESTPFCDTSFYLPENLKLGNHALHHAGAFYIQEPSACSVVEAADILSGDKVLDLCASPGGKSTQAATKIGVDGLLVSNEFVSSRVMPLVSNIERMGITNAVVTSMRPDELCKNFTEYFDKVIVDAPCSGEGMFRKESAAVENWSIENVKMCAVRQVKILNSAAASVKVGGKLIYSTCTYSPEENEMSVAKFLEENENFKLTEISKEFGESAFTKYAPNTVNIEYARRIFNFHGGEGHFVAVMEKTDTKETEFCGGMKCGNFKISKNFENEKIFGEFFSDNFNGKLPHEVLVQGDKVYITPNLCDFPEIKTVRKGIFAGTVKNGRFVPEHNLFNTNKFTPKRVIDFDYNSKEILQFLHGEEIACSKYLKGYTAVFVNGIPLGFGKASDGRLKNHYPKGLRNL